MKDLDFLQKLNIVLEERSEKLQLKPNNFCVGDIKSELLNALNEIAPHSRVAVLYTEKSAKELLKANNVLLKKAGFKVCDVILAEEAVFTVDNLVSAAVLPEDTRAILTFDYSLLTPLKYSATVNNLPAIFINHLNLIDGVLDSSDFIKNKAEVHEFNFSNSYTVIFNKDKKFSCEDLVCFRAGLDLIDYKIYCLLKNEEEDALVLSLLSEEKIDFSKIAINYEVANFLSQGTLKSSSAISCSIKAFVLANRKIPTVYQQAKIVSALYKMYLVGFKLDREKISEITNYHKLVVSAQKRCGLSFEKISTSILSFLDDLPKNLNRIENLSAKILTLLEKERLTEDLTRLTKKDKAKIDLRECLLDSICLNAYNGLGVLFEKGVVKSLIME